MSSISKAQAVSESVVKFELRSGAKMLSAWTRVDDKPPRDPSHISVFIEPQIVVTSHVSTEGLFTHAPVLRRFWDDSESRVVLPAGSVDEWGDATEDIVNELVKAAEKGTQPFVTIAWDPIWLINAHRTLVLFGRDSEAVQCIRALWTLLGHHVLTPEQVDWIWSTFSPTVSTTAIDNNPWPDGPYICPRADEYIQVMLWQLLNLRAEGRLEENVLIYMSLNTDLQCAMEIRYRMFKLESNNKRTEAAKRLNPFHELITNGVKRLRINEATQLKHVDKTRTDDNSNDTRPVSDHDNKSVSLDEHFSFGGTGLAQSCGTPTPLRALSAFNLSRSSSRLKDWSKNTSRYMPVLLRNRDYDEDDSNSEVAKPPRLHRKTVPAFARTEFQHSTNFSSLESKDPLISFVGLGPEISDSDTLQTFDASIESPAMACVSIPELQGQEQGVMLLAGSCDTQVNKEFDLRSGSTNVENVDPGISVAAGFDQITTSETAGSFRSLRTMPTESTLSSLSTSRNITSIFGDRSSEIISHVTFGDEACSTNRSTSGTDSTNRISGSIIVSTPNFPFPGINSSSYAPSTPGTDSSALVSNTSGPRFFDRSAGLSTIRAPSPSAVKPLSTNFQFCGSALSTQCSEPPRSQPSGILNAQDIGDSNPLNIQAGTDSGGGSNLFSFRKSVCSGSVVRRFARATGTKGSRKR